MKELLNTSSLTKSEFHLGFSPLTRTVFAGKMRRDPKHPGFLEAVGAKHDVTSDFYHVLLQVANMDNNLVEGGFTLNRADGSQAYDVTIKKIERQKEA